MTRPGGKGATKKLTISALPTKREKAYAGLIRILAGAPNDIAAVFAEVKEALDDPAGYLAGRGQDLRDERNLVEGDEVAWVTMVDRLGTLGWIGEADRRAGWKELRSNVDQALSKRVSRDRKRWAWVDESHLDDDTEPRQWLAECCKHFRKQAVVLVSIDIASSSWPIAAVPIDQVDKAVKLAKTIGSGKIVVLDEERRPTASRRRSAR